MPNSWSGTTFHWSEDKVLVFRMTNNVLGRESWIECYQCYVFWFHTPTDLVTRIFSARFPRFFGIMRKTPPRMSCWRKKIFYQISSESSYLVSLAVCAQTFLALFHLRQKFSKFFVHSVWIWYQWSCISVCVSIYELERGGHISEQWFRFRKCGSNELRLHGFDVLEM